MPAIASLEDLRAAQKDLLEVVQSRLTSYPLPIPHLGQTPRGNTLLKKDMFENRNNKFDPELGRTGGEDIDFLEE
jgi:hypothetical protein